jgi:hypothetical protein
MIFGRKKKNADKKDSAGDAEVPNLEIKASGVSKEESLGNYLDILWPSPWLPMPSTRVPIES